jgi:hypothetical protein
MEETPQRQFDLEGAADLGKEAIKLSCAASWEWCLDRLRYAEMDSGYAIEMKKIVNRIGSPALTSYYEEIEKQHLGGGGCYAGIKLLFGSIFRRGKTRSWSFPFPITSILVLFSTIFLIIGIVFTWLKPTLMMTEEMWILKATGRNVYVFFAITIPLVIAFLFFWRTMFRRLYRLMHAKGDRTVRAYCVRFLAPRSEYLAFYLIRCDWERFLER